jgi:hypothetical protein
VPKRLLFPSNISEAGVRTIWKAAVSRSYFLAYIHYFRKTQPLEQKESQASVSLAHWEDARQALDGMIQLSRETGATLLIFLYGSADMIEKNSVLRLYGYHLKGKSLHYFSLPVELFTDRRLRNSVVDGHPNSNGRALIARWIYEHAMPILNKLNTARPANQVNESAPERNVRIANER